MYAGVKVIFVSLLVIVSFLEFKAFAGFTVTMPQNSRLALINMGNGHMRDKSCIFSFEENAKGRCVSFIDTKTCCIVEINYIEKKAKISGNCEVESASNGNLTTKYTNCGTNYKCINNSDCGDLSALKGGKDISTQIPISP